ncbi:transposase [Calothrix sp. NIES-3974]|uniref:transposase n=1 Tax=Calothrix sp. NIES-3974 TaxID=2005462 RepID=UPI0018D571DC|nr:transposase [Calothrix sp. NIES-3974]
MLGWAKRQDFQTDHRVLNRAKWSSRRLGEILLRQLVTVFAPTGTLVMGLDETIERRWGQRIAARGIYRYNSQLGTVNPALPFRMRLRLYVLACGHFDFF